MTGRSSGGLDFLDAVFERHSLDDLGEVIRSTKLAPFLACTQEQLEKIMIFRSWRLRRRATLQFSDGPSDTV